MSHSDMVKLTSHTSSCLTGIDSEKSTNTQMSDGACQRNAALTSQAGPASVIAAMTSTASQEGAQSSAHHSP